MVENEVDGFHFMVGSTDNFEDNFSTKKTFSSLLVSGKCKLLGSLYNIVHSSKFFFIHIFLINSSYRNANVFFFINFYVREML